MEKEEMLFGLPRECYECKLKKYIYSVELPEEEKEAYVRKQLAVIENCDVKDDFEKLRPLLAIEYHKVVDQKPKDFKKIKSFYNQKILKLYPDLENQVNESVDPLAHAIKLAQIGNYIDFDALDNIQEEKLDNLLYNIKERTVDSKVYEDIKNDLANAKTLVYFLDNCGEIVFDKLLIN